YEGGIFLKGWQKPDEVVSLKTLLRSFKKIKKLKINSGMEDNTNFAKEVIRAMQFYKNLVEFDLSGFQLSDGMMEDIMESIAAPEKLKVLNVSNNTLSAELVSILEEKFSNAQVKLDGRISQAKNI